MYSVQDLHKGGVSPFGHPRINDRSHLPAAFRSVPRPSSPLGAKASTERPYRAHPPPAPARRTKVHTSKNQWQTMPSSTHSHTQPTIPIHLSNNTPQAQLRHNDPSRASGKPIVQQGCPTHRKAIRLSTARPKTLETVGFEPTTPCLQSRCSPTELRPQTPGTLQQRTWWAREDLNLRPHAYQACALTN